MSAYTVAVYNADGLFLNFVTLKKALKLLFKNKVKVIENSTTPVKTSSGVVFGFVPRVVQCLKFVAHVYKSRASYNKRAVFVRDEYKCQYCGKKLKPSGPQETKATLDHVFPRSRGGKNTWENTVCACFECNGKKGDRTPSEAGMTLLKKPIKPSIVDLTIKKAKVEGFDMPYLTEALG